MAMDDKDSEGKKKEVASFFRRALEEVVDFPEESGKPKKDKKGESLSRPPEKAKDISKAGDVVQSLHKAEPVQRDLPLGKPVSRRERKDSPPPTVVRPEPVTDAPVMKQTPAEKTKYAPRNKKSVGLKAGLDKLDNPMKKKIVAAAAVVCISVVTACSFLGGSEPDPKVIDETPMYIRIPSGMGAASIGEFLEEKQIISSQKYFLKRLRQSGKDGDIQSGTYRVHKGMKSDEVIELLVNGRVAAIKFTIPEGYNLNEMAKSLEKQGICQSTDFLKAAKSYKGLEYVGKSADIENPMEGYLFPDTYEVQPNAKAEDIVRLMAETFDDRLTDDMRAAARRYGLSIHEFVTLASLVEKEVMDDEDRPKVAQVFLKRLEIDMPIQSCATIQYLLKEPKEDLTFDDLKIDSPYNTYEHPGLPPGPIASPSREALEATAHPSDTNYLYFVADRQGKTYYSETFDEHMEKVEKYR